VGREWPGIEGPGRRGSPGLVHRALRALAGDKCGSGTKGFI